MPIGSVEFEMGSLIQKLRHIAPEMHKGMKTLVKEASVITVRKAVEMTPPGWSGLSGKEAKKRGETAIAVDLFGGKRGTGKGENKHSRRMGIFFSVRGAILKKFDNVITGKKGLHIKKGEAEDKKLLFKRKDGSVYATRENLYRPNASMSEMDAHHKRYFKNGRMTSSVSELATTGQWVFVDKFVTTTEKLKEFMRFLQMRVGIWAAGWMPAVSKLNVSRIPGWVKRHSAIAKGRCEIQDNGYSFFMEAANSTGYGDLSRILPYALAGAKEAMAAQVPAIKKKALAKAGFKKAA